MKRMFTVLLALWLAGPAPAQPADPVDWVNPLMGTDSKPSLSNGNTYPAIALPWGMNLWTPQTGENGSGWQYTYAADKIRGFKQTHQPSPWMNDYGMFSIMPVTGGLKVGQDARASWFSHKTETSTPYYYSVYLADADVTAEMVPTERSAQFRFTYPESDSASLVIDAFDGGSSIRIIPAERKIVGYSTKFADGPLKNFRNYFVVYVDKAITFSQTYSDTVLSPGQETTADHALAVIGFATKKGERVHLRVASSFISAEQAELNLRREQGAAAFAPDPAPAASGPEKGSTPFTHENASTLSAHDPASTPFTHENAPTPPSSPGDDFETLKYKARETWNKTLGRVTVRGGTTDQLRTFYSCLYRMLFFPNKLYELNADNQPIHWSPYNGETLPGYMFAGTGFWDTFRALYPFLNLVYPSVVREMQEGLINDYREGGWLPEWSSPGYADVMVGNNSASVVAEAWLKGLRGYDIETLYKALIHDAAGEGPRAAGRKGAGFYNGLGYVPYDVHINENAARTLEYAYDDFAIWQLGKALGKPAAEIDPFRKRALNYRNLFDPTTNLMRGRNKDGSWETPFNPFKWGDAFTEGNSWHYTWCVFQDVQGLIDLMGGRQRFTAKLDSVFTLPPIFDDSYYHFVIHEIREMQIAGMGQYAHGNQPIQHMIYLYDYAGQPWKAQYWARETMNKLYRATPDGYCGDEDNGQTSAWYVFSALGFYPVTPASDQYALGAPLFRHAIIHLENGKTLTINAPANGNSSAKGNGGANGNGVADGNGGANVYVQSLLLNGAPWPHNWLSHQTLLRGATLDFTLSPVPNKTRGSQPADAPWSMSAPSQ